LTVFDECEDDEVVDELIEQKKALLEQSQTHVKNKYKVKISFI